MRSRMTGIRTYADPVNIGQVMVGGTVGQVVQSKNPKFQAGEIFEGYWGWQEYAVSNGEKLRKLDPGLAPISTALGVLGMPGMTAYFGFSISASRSPAKPSWFREPRARSVRWSARSPKSSAAARWE